MSVRPYKISTILLILLLTVGLTATAQAQKTLSGTISVNTTLDTVGGAVYQVIGNVTVNAGVTLTVDPGVVLKFDPSRQMTVYGTLSAVGGLTPATTIVFTSIKDDDAPLGAGEDTNLDGGATTPAAGDWYYVTFSGAGASASVMENCVVRYGGQGNYPMVRTVTNAAPTFDTCDLSYSYEGFYVYSGSAPTIRDTSINQMTNVPVTMTLEANPVFDNIIIDDPSGNGHDAIEIANGNVIGTATIPVAPATIGGTPVHCLSYWVVHNITVGAGETLDIDPGVVLKFNPSRGVHNYGLLNAIGGAPDASQIYFTSIDDDNAPAPLGQDTNNNGNGTVPDRQDWYGVFFYDSSDDLSELRHCQVLFAGQGTSSYGAVDCTDASPSLVNCDLTSAYYGILCRGVSSPLLSNTSINAMQDVPIAIEISCDPVFDNLVFESTSDNGFDAIGILGGTLTGSNTLRIRGAQLGATPIDNLVYILLSDITVDTGGNLTVDPGVVAKPRTYVDIWVDGALYMDGTADPDSQIVLTSYKDDTYGNPNDTNNDGSITAPAKGDWGHIRFNAGATGSITHTTLRFGSLAGYGLISCESASPTLADLTISETEYGIRQAGISASSITDVDIANTTYTPVLMSISAEPVYSGITFTNVGLRAIGLIGETIGVDSTLRIRSMGGYDGITYYLASAITIAEGAHFRFEPGITLKFGVSAYNRIWVSGSLEAVATNDSTIAFTGIYDDTRGNPGDTAGDGANSPAASQWGFIQFGPTSVDVNCLLEKCVLAYSGNGYSGMPYAAVWCNSSSPTIRDCDFETNYIGVWSDGSAAPNIEDNHFFNHSSVPLATSVVSDPQFSGNTFDQNTFHAVGLISETLAENATLEKISLEGYVSYPYYNLGTTTISSGTMLTIEPGVLIKARDGSDVFTVHGNLQATGLPGDRIVMTTIRDDSLGGDSNVDGGGTLPGAGNWHGIYFSPTSNGQGSLVEHHCCPR